MRITVRRLRGAKVTMQPWIKRGVAVTHEAEGRGTVERTERWSPPETAIVRFDSGQLRRVLMCELRAA